MKPLRKQRMLDLANLSVLVLEEILSLVPRTLMSSKFSWKTLILKVGIVRSFGACVTN